MAMQVYSYDGKPILVFHRDELPEKYTMIRPPEGIWEPFYFDEENQKWIGSEPPVKDNEEDDSEEDVKPAPPPNTPNPMMMAIANSNLVIAKQANTIKNLEEQKEILNQLLATSYLEMTKIKYKKNDGEEV